MFSHRVVSAATIVLLAAASIIPAGAAPQPAGGGPVVVKQTPHCSAYAPSDGSVSSNPQASALDLQSGDGTMYAGWGVAAINRALQPYYGPMYGDPETSIRTLAGAIVAKLYSHSRAAVLTILQDAAHRVGALEGRRVLPDLSGQFASALYRVGVLCDLGGV